MGLRNTRWISISYKVTRNEKTYRDEIRKKQLNKLRRNDTTILFYRFPSLSFVIFPTRPCACCRMLDCDVYILPAAFFQKPFCIKKLKIGFQSVLIAERLSVRQLIVQCGLKSQLAYIYIYIYMCATSVTLRNAIESQVMLLIHVITMSVRSVYVLLLRL